MQLFRPERKDAWVDVDVKNPDGSDAQISAVDLCILPQGQTPTEDTDWTAGVYQNGGVPFILAGPDADPTGALWVQAIRSNLWVKTSYSGRVDIARATPIFVQ